MAFPTFYPQSTGLPTQRSIDGYTRKWEPDPNTWIGQMFLPMEDWPMPNVEWDELQPVTGLANPYAIGTAPMVSSLVSLKNFIMKPLYWGDSYRLTSEDVVNSRMPGDLTKNGGEFLAMEQVRMGNLRLDSRIEQQRWAAILNSNVVASNGIVRTISYTGFAGTPVAAQPWNNVALATPLDDLQAWAELFDGKSDGKIRAIMNHRTVKWCARNEAIRQLARANSNIEDIGVKNIGEVLTKFSGAIDEVIVYKGGYLDASQTKQFFIPEGVVVLIADPPLGQKLGAFRTTPSTLNGGLRPRPGRFAITDDQLQTKHQYWEATIGIHGLPILKFPQCIAIAQAYTP